MSRRPGISATILFSALGFVLTLTASAFGQDHSQRPPSIPESVVGPQLIVWSPAQKPRPVPQPLPPPDGTDPQSNARPPEHSANAGAEQPPAQSFLGTILKDGTKYVLKQSGDTEYSLDDQGRAAEYAGRKVKITGTLDEYNVLHIASIKPLA